MQRPARLVITLVLLAAYAAASGCEDRETREPVLLVDLEGREVDPLAGSQAKATVFLFTRTDCPVSNRYAPVVRDLCDAYTARGVDFYLVYPDPEATPAKIRAHLKEYGYTCSALRDPQHRLVHRTAARVTPEAAVFTDWEHMPYRGRIDDRYVNFGQARAEVGRRDLAEAIDAVLDGQPVTPATTQAVGCYIADLK